MTAPNRPSAHSDWQSAVYDQLHALARLALAQEKPGHSLQTTLVANDAYMRLMQQRNHDPEDPLQARAIGATIIHRLLVDYARQRKARKRGGPDGRGFSLQASMSEDASSISLLEINDALAVMAKENARAAQVVEMRFFGGLTVVEIAEALQISVRTVNYDWRYARA